MSKWSDLAIGDYAVEVYESYDFETDELGDLVASVGEFSILEPAEGEEAETTGKVFDRNSDLSLADLTGKVVTLIDTEFDIVINNCTIERKGRPDRSDNPNKPDKPDRGNRGRGNGRGRGLRKGKGRGKGNGSDSESSASEESEESEESVQSEASEDEQPVPDQN